MGKVVQGIFQAHSTQTNNVLEICNTGGSNVASFNKDGHLGVNVAPLDNTLLRFGQTDTDPIATRLGFDGAVTYVLTANNTKTSIGGRGQAVSRPDVGVEHGNTATGLLGQGIMDGAGVGKFIVGLQAQVQELGSGSITNGYGLFVTSASGNIGTFNGVYVAAQSAATVNNAIRCLSGHAIFNDNADAAMEVWREKDPGFSIRIRGIII